MAVKITGYWSEDYLNRKCLILEKKKGHINQREVYEWMSDHKMQGCSYVHMADCPLDVIPTELYEEGETWVLYEAEYILPELVQRASDETGYSYRLIKE